jgi:hypothetical protein
MKNESDWCAMLDALTQHTTRDACRISGVGHATWYRKLAASVANPEQHVVAWSEYGEAPIHEHARTALRISTQELLDALMQRAKNNTRKPLYYQGRPVWQYDPRIDPADYDKPELLKMSWGQRDPYLRDANGNLVQACEEVTHDGAALGILAGLMPKVFGSKHQLEVRHSGQQVVIHRKIEDEFAPEKRVVSAPQVPSLPPPALSGGDAPDVVDAEYSEVAADPASAVSGEPMSELRRDLEARLAALREKGPQHARPQRPVAVNRDLPDNPREEVTAASRPAGHGTPDASMRRAGESVYAGKGSDVKPGGFKIQ